MMPIFLRPGEEQMEYKIYHRSSDVNNRGRTTYAIDEEPVGTLFGSVSAAHQSEVERFKQLGHPVSHTIVVHCPTVAGMGDVLMRGDDVYNVEGKDNLAGLGAFYVLYLNKKEGVPDAKGNS